MEEYLPLVELWFDPPREGTTAGVVGGLGSVMQRACKFNGQKIPVVEAALLLTHPRERGSTVRIKTRVSDLRIWWETEPPPEPLAPIEGYRYPLLAVPIEPGDKPDHVALSRGPYFLDWHPVFGTWKVQGSSASEVAVELTFDARVHVNVGEWE